MLQGGNYVATACAAVGIHRDTYYEWLRQGQEPGASPELRSFAEDVMQASASSEAELVSLIRTSAADDWRAAAFLIERRHPKRWNEKTEQKVTASVGVALDDIDKLRRAAEQNECEPPKTTKGEPNS